MLVCVIFKLYFHVLIRAHFLFLCHSQLRISSHLRGQAITIWSDSQVAVSILQSGWGSDPVLHTISRNIWLLNAALDCDLDFCHIPGRHNKVADLLSRWDARPEPEPLLASLLPSPAVCCPVPHACLVLDEDI
jgi:hypothetical protein